MQLKLNRVKVLLNQQHGHSFSPHLIMKVKTDVVDEMDDLAIRAV
jgi:hypothetical protein